MPWSEWIRTVEVEPSIYGADFLQLGEQLDVLLRADCRIFHFDVGDGHFVEPITMGPIVLRAISPIVHGMDGALDCHLMVDNPVRHFPQIAEAGGDSVTFHYEAVDDVPGAYRVDRVDDDAVSAGRIWPQSRGSQLAGLVVGAQEGERTLDLCAAPGGKTMQLRGDVTAVEIDPNRASELRSNLATLGATSVIVVEADGTALPPDLAGFDRALVDAPCSGLGVLAQRPDLRWRSKPLPELQLALLRGAAERVRPGGTVVYSVCTINADENEAIVDASGLRVDPLGAEWPQFAHPRRPEFLLTLPHVHGTSGFFVARLTMTT